MIKVTLRRESDKKKLLSYIGMGDLFNIHESAEDSVQKLQGLKAGDRVFVSAVETKTGNSLHTPVTFNGKFKVAED